MFSFLLCYWPCLTLCISYNITSNFPAGFMLLLVFFIFSYQTFFALHLNNWEHWLLLASDYFLLKAITFYTLEYSVLSYICRFAYVTLAIFHFEPTELDVKVTYYIIIRKVQAVDLQRGSHLHVCLLLHYLMVTFQLKEQHGLILVYCRY